MAYPKIKVGDLVIAVYPNCAVYHACLIDRIVNDDIAVFVNGDAHYIIFLKVVNTPFERALHGVS